MGDEEVEIIVGNPETLHTGPSVTSHVRTHAEKGNAYMLRCDDTVVCSVYDGISKVDIRKEVEERFPDEVNKIEYVSKDGTEGVVEI